MASLTLLLLPKLSSSNIPVTVAPPAVKSKPFNLVLKDVALLDVVASHLALAWSYMIVEPASLEPTVSSSVVLPNNVAAPARP